MSVARLSAYERAVLGDNPTNWYRFKSGAELANSISGAAGSLTKTGTAVEVASLLTDAVTATEKARDLNGTTGYYDAADHASLDVGDVFTVEAWVRPDTLPGVSAPIVQKGTGAFRVEINGSGVISLLKVGTGTIATSTRRMVAGTTYHVVVTKNGAAAKIYVNGADETTLITNQTLTDTASVFRIGADSAPARFWNGVISEVAVYKTIVLSEARVWQHYLAGSDPFVQTLGTEGTGRYPKTRLVVGFESGPKTEYPKWTQVTDRLRSWGSTRGRSHELSTIDTGTWDGVLSNRDRALESEYAASPYFPNVKPTKQLLLSSYWDGVHYDHFHGTVSDWGPAWLEKGADSVVSVKAKDGQKLANLQVLTGALSQESTGTRIGNVLTTLGVPSGMRDIDTGNPDVVAVADAEGTNALAHLQETAKAEPGVLFIDAGGWWVFQDRGHRTTNEEQIRATFGDDTGELPYVELRPRDDDADIFNDIRITVAGTSAVRTASDSTSDDEHGTRSKAESLALVTNAQGDAVASYWLNLFKDPKRRIVSIDIAGVVAPTDLWPVLLAAEISWRTLVVRRPLGGGVAIFTEQYVEGVTFTADPQSWLTSFTLSPADTNVYWELGVAGKSELGATTWIFT